MVVVVRVKRLLGIMIVVAMVAAGAGAEVGADRAGGVSTQPSQDNQCRLVD